MTKTATWLTATACIGLLYGASQLFLGDDQSAGAERGNQDPGLLFDRVWLDSTPEKFTDFVHAFIVVEDAPLGVFQKASAYRIEAEAFGYKYKDSKLAVHFPQTKKTARMGFSISTCDDLPPFDLCLQLDKNPWGGPTRYYSSTDGGEALLELRRELLRTLDRIAPDAQRPSP